MTVKITILGLHRVGTSIGLALGKIKDQIQRVGNDREPTVARQAEKMGAVDKIVFNLPGAVRDADLVILALPVNQIRETLEIIAPDLKAGVVVIDTSPVRQAVMSWVQELIPADDRYFVGLTPSLNPAHLLDSGDDPQHARADLFQNSLMLMTCPPGIDDSAVSLASNLVQLLNATPLFTDSAEADGLTAYSHLLPRLAAAALVNSTSEQPGWREARKMAGPAYAHATEPALLGDESQGLGQAALLNKDNTVRMLDQLILELSSLRDLIEEGEAEELQDRLARAQAARERWWTERQKGEWEVQPNQGADMPTSGEIFSRMFGIRPRKDKK